VSVPDSVPDITPVLEFKDKPVGSDPDATEYAMVESEVAATVTLIAAPCENVPSVPAAVVQVGASETVRRAVADLPEKPLLFSTLM